MVGAYLPNLLTKEEADSTVIKAWAEGFRISLLLPPIVIKKYAVMYKGKSDYIRYINDE